MFRRALLLALAAATVAGCIVSHGATPPPSADAAIDVKVGCAGEACGRSGTLFTTLQPDCAGAPIATTSNGGVTLTSSAAFSTGYPTVYAGNYCVAARLVVDSGTVLVPSSTPSLFEVFDHQTATIPITLDTAQ